MTAIGQIGVGPPRWAVLPLRCQWGRSRRHSGEAHHATHIIACRLRLLREVNGGEKRNGTNPQSIDNSICAREILLDSEIGQRTGTVCRHGECSQHIGIGSRGKCAAGICSVGGILKAYCIADTSRSIIHRKELHRIGGPGHQIYQIDCQHLVVADKIIQY